MKIDGTCIGSNHDPFFIAEAGVNHNGSLDRAKKLIDVAADAGADAVKFQTFSADRLVTPDASTARYQESATGETDQHEMLKQYEIDRAKHRKLFDYCSEQDITFLSTPFDPESADMLADLGVSAFKIGSGELDNHPLLTHIAEYGLPMVVSTGMGTMSEVRKAHNAVRSVSSDIDISFLHCTSAYPTPITDVNLRAMETMSEEFPLPVGFSDHTTMPETTALAVAAGACIVEKHFTVDSTLPGPDHEASLEPDELCRAVALVKQASAARGGPTKEPTANELENLEQIRKGLYAATDIPADTRITKAHIDIMRPAVGLSPQQYDSVLGRRTTDVIDAGDPLTTANIDIESKEDD
ncbi:N-acetylneuraminate synthase [Natrinema salsiterrestre]|uniref:N-acetylneuraminate synthase n=1 Tax=Natrinema salsiterrestre TaxID=2950540 RepID=A0A9Q4L1X1_9EURY|nr:N-acetylneuraminate synthase [Natrinema salsiterrestre]MDF9745849.1 N-acetylneuraminate synthase [Natrinema salsiterrestre]